MRKRLMASTAAIIIVGFLVAFALAAKLVQDQYQLEFTRRLDSILAMMESQVDDIGQDPQGFAVKIGKELQEKGQEIRITILDSGGNVIGDSGIGEQGTLPAENHLYRPEIQQAQKENIGYVKALEEQGIGRPSTYAPTISTIIARHYVIKENKNLYISELGNAVNNIMMTAFPTIVDVKFTANMESLLDGVAEGTVEWKEIIRNFYPDLKVAIDEAEKELEHVKIEDEVTDVICDKCGRNMVIKYGPHGKFLGCPGESIPADPFCQLP